MVIVKVVIKSNSIGLTKAEIDLLPGLVDVTPIECLKDNDPTRAIDFIIITCDIPIADIEDIYTALTAHKYAISFVGNMADWSVFEKL